MLGDGLITATRQAVQTCRKKTASTSKILGVGGGEVVGVGVRGENWSVDLISFD